MRLLYIVAATAILSAPALAQNSQDNPAPNQVKPAQGTSPDAQPSMFQPLGAFPTNDITSRPYVGPQNGEKGLKETVGALQRTLTELQQLELQLKEAHWNVSGAEFYQLHIELQKHFEGVIKLADMVAQRLLAVGASADGRATTIVKTSRVPEMPGGFIDDAQVVAWFTDRVGALTTDFFTNLLDTDTVWEKAHAEGMGFVGRDRASGAEKFRASRFDLVFGANAQLRSTADVYAGSDGQERFVRDFVRAWEKVIMLDRYDVKGHRRYAPMAA